MDLTSVAAAVDSSSVAELCWTSVDGAPRVRGTVVLLREETPVLAFTYADAEVARAVARSPEVVLALSEPRSTGRRFRPLTVRGRPHLVEDPTGRLFRDELLVQELRRYPPARLYADSPLLCREHWWYLPRLVVEIDVAALEPLPGRTPPTDHLLVVAGAGGLAVAPAAVIDQRTDTLLLDLARPAPAGPAVLFGQDASFPDLERWTQWRWTGRHDGGRLLVEEAPSRTGLERPPGLLERWRRQRDLERRCRAALP